MKIINRWVCAQTGELTPKPVGKKNDSYIIVEIIKERKGLYLLIQTIIYARTKYRSQKLL